MGAPQQVRGALHAGIALQRTSSRACWSQSDSRAASATWSDIRDHVGVEVREIAERLHEQDQAGTGTGSGERVRLEEQARGDAAEFSERCPMPAEERAQEHAARNECGRGRGVDRRIR